jgi:hypothetical protein
MLYLGIDQHARQLTISLRNDAGDVVQARQVSTRPEKIQEFFTKLTRKRLCRGESFIAVVEVCGFNDWLIPFDIQERFRRQDGPSRNALTPKNLEEEAHLLGATGECAGDNNCRELAASGNFADPTIRYIANAWPTLPPPIQEAILTLVDASRREGDYLSG